MTPLGIDITLSSNGIPLSMDPRRLGGLIPTDPTRPRAELWEQYQAQGYLWLKGLLDRQDVLGFRICTSWIPIGDIAVVGGGLIYLEDSDRWGRRKEAEFAALNHSLPPQERISAYNKNMTTGWLSNDLAAMADDLNTRWLVADYEAGDMVVHSPYMVHASTMNVDPQQHIRLSTDIRYQRVRDEIDVRWTNHWSYDDML